MGRSPGFDIFNKPDCVCEQIAPLSHAYIELARAALPQRRLVSFEGVYSVVECVGERAKASLDTSM